MSFKKTVKSNEILILVAALDLERPPIHHADGRKFSSYG